MDLSIIIVNWNSVQFLRSCLTSIYWHVQDIEFEVIVVDNASFDGSAELVRREFPKVVFLQAEANLGFGRANNLGFTRSSGNLLLFLNPDTEVPSAAVQTMVAQLRALPDAGAMGCKLLNSDGSIQESSVQAFPTIANQVLDSDLLRRRFRHWKLWGNSALFQATVEPVAVDMISGACLMVKRTVFEKAGRFNSGLFMYADDLSLCYRLRQAGYTVCYVGDAQVIHHGGSSAALKDDRHFSTVLQRQSLLCFFRETRGRFYALLYRVTSGTAAACRVVLIPLLLPFWALVAPKAPPILSFTKWVRVLRWAVGLEAWAKRIGPVLQDPDKSVA